MGLDVSPQSLVARADAGGVIRNLRAACQTFDALGSGQFTGDLNAALQAILVQTQCTERQLPAYKAALRALVALMQETALARATHPLPAGPTVEFPARPRGEPVGPPVLDFDVFDHFGRTRP